MDLSNLTANEWCFLEGPLSSCSSVSMPTGRTYSRSPGVAPTPQVPAASGHPRSAADIAREGTNSNTADWSGLYHRGACSLLEEDGWEHPCLAAVPGAGCYTFTSSILLPNDSALQASSTGAAKDLRLEGWGLWVTHRHMHNLHRSKDALRVPLSIRSCLKSELFATWVSQAEST